MALIAPIQPSNTSKPAVEAKLKFVNTLFQPGDGYAFAHVELFDEDGLTVAQHQVQFTEAELADWGTDDSFVLTLALQKLGLTQA